MERLKEALEANDWEAGEELEDLGFEDFDGDEDDTESLGFGIEAAEMEAEMFGMKQAIYSGTQDREDEDGEGEGEQDEDVEQLQAMMLKLQAVRGMYLNLSSGQFTNRRLDLGADMPEKERKKFAAKAVGDIMKTL